MTPRFTISQRAGGSHDAAHTRRRVATLLCLLLLVVFMLVQVGHTHSLASDPDHCPVCVVLHSAAPVTTAQLALPVTAVAATQTRTNPVHRSRDWHYELFNRPPPYVR